VTRQVQRRGAHQRPKSLHQPRAAQQAGVVRFRFIININIIIIIINLSAADLTFKRESAVRNW
jgi:hypothetical protein